MISLWNMNIYLSKINLFEEQILYNFPRNRATNYNNNINSKKVVEEGEKTQKS